MVSIIMPSHNSADTIADAINSVIRQTYTDWELIIIDNGSVEELSIPDNITEDFPVTLISYAEVLGSAEARNIGVSRARGEYIAYLDADDYWSSDKLEKQIRVMERYKYHGESPRIVCSGRRIVDSDGRDTDRYIGCRKIITYDILKRSNQINCSSVLLRREDALSVPFPDGKLHEDYAVWLSLLRDGGYAAGIDRPLLIYRSSASSKSGNKLRSAIMTYRVYRYMHFNIFSSIIYMITYTLAGINKHYLIKR